MVDSGQYTALTFVSPKVYTFAEDYFYGNLYDIPSAQDKEETDPRLPAEDEHQRGQEGPSAETRKRPETVDRLTYRSLMEHPSVHAGRVVPVDFAVVFCPFRKAEAGDADSERTLSSVSLTSQRRSPR